MSKPTDIRVESVAIHYLPIVSRVPVKFGHEVVTSVTCVRARVVVSDRQGRTAEGWGETPLSVQWAWPGAVPYDLRLEVMSRFCSMIAEAMTQSPETGHPLEIGQAFLDDTLPRLLDKLNEQVRATSGPMPRLAALVCCSAFDLAVHDAYGNLLGRPTYSTYGPQFMNRDLASYLEPAAGTSVSFAGKYPQDFLRLPHLSKVRAWHLVAGLDPLEPADLTGSEPDDGDPVLLPDWIHRDGLKLLKIKLRGNDAAWDYDRIVRVGAIAIERGVEWLTADFNCTVQEPAYVNAILDRLRDEQPRLFGMMLYVEQPFPYELDEDRIDVHSLAARKPLFMDESAHDWRVVRLGRELGWNGVALKTCKTQTGALLSLCWAKAHGMALMVQDLGNPMLAMLTHALLAAHTDTIMGFETNSSQFYPYASAAEATIHPGLYRRREGAVDLATLGSTGFGYRLDEIPRSLPPAAAEFRCLECGS